MTFPADTRKYDIVGLGDESAVKRDSYNTALVELDIVNGYVKALDLVNQPQGCEPDGTVYIVDTGATGDFAGQANDIAYKRGGVWKFIQVIGTAEATQAWLVNQDRIALYNGVSWVGTEYIWECYADANQFPSTGGPPAQNAAVQNIINKINSLIGALRKLGYCGSIRRLDGGCYYLPTVTRANNFIFGGEWYTPKVLLGGTTQTASPINMRGGELFHPVIDT